MMADFGADLVGGLAHAARPCWICCTTWIASISSDGDTMMTPAR